ncbi:hypothetical protein DDQ41_15160 [Streptomyces spongiicola]|uniref:Uncharacterized protein n=2 Tax=Streptomyces spongiicola TaxID=1690221 RepID=A0ABM6V7J2_9ACTN|nr:hypothetical protein DDQ41_15160 [Streptomyces spongiicola]
MMRWLLLGALLGLLIMFPALLTAVVGAATAAVSEPVVTAFVIGLTAPRRPPRLALRRTP